MKRKEQKAQTCLPNGESEGIGPGGYCSSETCFRGNDPGIARGKMGVGTVGGYEVFH